MLSFRRLEASLASLADFFVRVVAVCVFGTSAAHASDFMAHQVTAPNGMKSVLIGTMHQRFPGVTLPDLQIFEGIKTLVIEHTTHDESAEKTIDPAVLQAKKAGNPNAIAAWAQGVTPEHRARIEKNLACRYGVAPMSDERFLKLRQFERPRELAAMAWTPCVPDNLFSRDEWLYMWALDKDMRYAPLETQEEVEPRRRSISKALHAQALYEGLEADLSSLYRAMAMAITNADYETVYSLAKPHGKPEDVEHFLRVMVAERNALWLPRLQRLLDDGPVIVGVGAAHLGSETGLISLLQRSGYKVELVKLPAAF